MLLPLPAKDFRKLFTGFFFICQPIKMSEAARVFRWLVTSSISPPPELAWPVIGSEIRQPRNG